MNYANLTHMQTEMLLEEIRQRGELVLAAHLLGLPVSTLRRFIAQDPELGEAVQQATEHHAALIYVTALQRASGPGGNEALLGKVLEAKHKEFNKFHQQAEAGKASRPTGILVRNFTEGSDGDVQDATPKTTDQTEPLRIGYKIF